MNPRLLRIAGPAVLVGTAIVATVVALAYGGGADPLDLGDAGPVVRWGLPIANLLFNLGAAAMLGPLVLALFALRSGRREFDLALDVASVGAAVFTVGAAATGFLTFLNAFNASPSLDEVFGQQLGRFLVELPLGQAWLITTLAGAVLTVLTFAVRTWTPTLFVALIAIAALIPMATTSHDGAAANHGAAVTSLALHIVGAAVWLGGLLLLIVLRASAGDTRLAQVLPRYSSIALVAFIVVAVSGYARAALAVGAWSQLATPYGVLIIVKVVALIILGLLGASYRRFLIGRMTQGPSARRFWGLVLVEFAFMGIASGVAAALARTAPPIPDVPLDARTPAEYLTGAPLPPELTTAGWITSWNVDVLWLLVVGFGAFFYLAGVWRLHRRGDAWPIYRTVLWLAGLALLFWVTTGAVAVYEQYLFSVHMVGHMLLTMAIPLLLVSGAPVSLAARAIVKRDDGTRGGREWILWAVHSPAARILTNPFVAAALFILSLWVFYYTDLFRWSLYEHFGHLWMVAHFLITGYLFVLSLIGIDPVPFRLPYAGRLILLIAIMAMHAFFGISIMMQSGLMAAEWFGAMGRTWGATPMEDQYIGGGIAWSVGEIPTLILAITVAIQWSRSDERMQRRRDRHADRTGDAELDEYNARLAALAVKDARIER